MSRLSERTVPEKFAARHVNSTHFEYTAPVGLEGVHRMSSRDLGVSTARSLAADKMKPSSSVVCMITGFEPTWYRSASMGPAQLRLDIRGHERMRGQGADQRSCVGEYCVSDDACMRS